MRTVGCTTISGETSVYATSDAPADPEAEAARASAESALSSARSDLNAKRNTLTDQHPDVIAAKNRVAAAEKTLQDAEAKVAASRLQNTAAAGAKLDPEAAKQKLRDKKRKIDAEIAQREKPAKGTEDKSATPAPATEEATSIVGLETSWARLSRDVSEARDAAPLTTSTPGRRGSETLPGYRWRWGSTGSSSP